MNFQLSSAAVLFVVTVFASATHAAPAATVTEDTIDQSCAKVAQVLASARTDRFDSLKGSFIGQDQNGNKGWKSPIYFVADPGNQSQCTVVNWGNSSAPTLYCTVIPENQAVEAIRTAADKIIHAAYQCLGNTWTPKQERKETAAQVIVNTSFQNAASNSLVVVSYAETKSPPAGAVNLVFTILSR